MNWRKGIRDVIDDIISRMELISEAVENDGHIIVYIKNDMVNYCPYAFHIVYEVAITQWKNWFCRNLMTSPGAEVLEITQEGILSVNYKDIEHFMVTKRSVGAQEKIC